MSLDSHAQPLLGAFHLERKKSFLEVLALKCSAVGIAVRYRLPQFHTVEQSLTSPCLFSCLFTFFLCFGKYRVLCCEIWNVLNPSFK